MSLKRIFQVTCDACGLRAESEQYAFLKETGFKYFAESTEIKHFCPECAKCFAPHSKDPDRVV